MKFTVKRGQDERRPVALLSNNGKTLYLQLDATGMGPAAQGKHVVLGANYGPKHKVQLNGTLDVTNPGNYHDYTPIYEGDTVEVQF